MQACRSVKPHDVAAAGLPWACAMASDALQEPFPCRRCCEHRQRRHASCLGSCPGSLGCLGSCQGRPDCQGSLVTCRDSRTQERAADPDQDPGVWGWVSRCRRRHRSSQLGIRRKEMLLLAPGRENSRPGLAELMLLFAELSVPRAERTTVAC